jgi:mannose-6-phosphate isomerase
MNSCGGEKSSPPVEQNSQRLRSVSLKMIQTPIFFERNRVGRVYIGGKLFSTLFGDSPEDGYKPEEWIASATEAYNPDMPKAGEGLSISTEGEVFCELLQRYPEHILGKRCAELDGAKLSLLVKLLDSAERLVIQCHPTVEFAKERFGSDFGKTECWYMLSAEEDACVYLGFKEGITREKWISLFETQNVQGMLDCLHRFNVKKGELWFVEGGVPHAIGGGCLMIELQEPSDLMVIPERVTPSGIALAEKKLHGGLGFGGMFDCFVYNGLSEEETKKRYRRAIAPEKNRMVDIVDNTLTEKFSMKLLSTDG